MNPITYAFGIVAALLALIAIIELMRRGTLRERHALWWFIGGILALAVAVFPQTLTWAAQTLGVSVPTNLVFFEVRVDDPASLASRLNDRGVKGGSPQRRWRYATHYGITADDVDHALEVIESTLREYAPA